MRVVKVKLKVSASIFSNHLFGLFIDIYKNISMFVVKNMKETNSQTCMFLFQSHEIDAKLVCSNFIYYIFLNQTSLAFPRISYNVKWALELFRSIPFNNSPSSMQKKLETTGCTITIQPKFSGSLACQLRRS